MAVHPVDVAALVVGLIASASLFYLVHTDSETGLTCNFPAHFTDSSIEHGTATCRGEDASWFPVYFDSQPNFTETAELRDMYNQPPGITTLFLADGAVAIFFFMLATSVFSSCPTEKPVAWMVAYAVFDGFALIGWLALGIKSHLVHNVQESIPATSILCTYKVRVLGNYQKYGIQCHVSKSNTLDIALQANIAVCFALAIGFASHVLVTFLATFRAGMGKPASSAKQDLLQMEKQ